jgi:hypothetical protein
MVSCAVITAFRALQRISTCERAVGQVSSLTRAPQLALRISYLWLQKGGCMRVLVHVCVLSLAGIVGASNVTLAQDLTFNGRPFVPSFEMGTNIRNVDGSTVYEINPALTGEGLMAAPITLRRRNDCYGRADDHVVKVWSHVLNMPSIIKSDTLMDDPNSCLPTLGGVSVGQLVDLLEPDNGAHHVGMAAWTARGRSKVQGVIRYESDDAFGICGGAVVGLLDATGRLLHYYTPPTGCGDGKIGGRANQRFVAWEDTIPQAIRRNVRAVRVQPMFTKGRDKFTWERLTGMVASAAEKAKEVAKLLKAVGVL